MLLPEAPAPNTEITEPETEEQRSYNHQPVRLRQTKLGVDFGPRDYRQDNRDDPQRPFERPKEFVLGVVVFVHAGYEARVRPGSLGPATEKIWKITGQTSEGWMPLCLNDLAFGVGQARPALA